ncbi:MAG: hypothetical protein EOP86_01745 [Verrucomicrobiaceae bacterium]|nr:MAG: hypothetical protein EOP86_01745 [Verrucomicrobiaceae bacterium]
MKNLVKGGSPRPAETGEERAIRVAKLKAVLTAELSQTQVDGRPVTHRRLESLIRATGAGKRETVQLLREIGARPSRRRGSDLWTME